MDPALEKHIDQLYRSSKQMLLASLLGVLIPIVLLLAAPLGLLYAYQRSCLLKRVDAGDVDLLAGDSPGSDGLTSSEKIEYLRDHSMSFLIPTIVLAGVAIFIVAIVVGQS